MQPPKPGLGQKPEDCLNCTFHDSLSYLEMLIFYIIFSFICLFAFWFGLAASCSLGSDGARRWVVQGPMRCFVGVLKEEKPWFLVFCF